jgi:hypothetical protein
LYSAIIPFIISSEIPSLPLDISSIVLRAASF